MQHGSERLPILAHQEGRHGSLQGGYPASCFGIAGRYSVPDPPDIFPTLPADAVEKSELQIIGLVAIPAVGNMDHMARFEPLVTVYPRHERKLILAPGHDVVSHGFILRSTFGLKRQRVSDLVRGLGERTWHAIL